MKKVLAWLKVNWPIVLCSIVILAALPAGIIVGGSFQQKLVDDVKNTVEADFKELSADKITYDIPAPIPGQPKFDFAGQPPNATVIEEFAKRRTELSGQLGSVAGEAVAFNRGNRKPLIENFFPDPSTAAQQKRAEFTKAFIALGDRLYASIDAGLPPVDKDVFEAVRAFRDQQFIKAQTELGVSDKEVPLDRRRQIRDQMLEIRKNAYRSRAGEISVFFDRKDLEIIPVALRPDLKDFDMREAWDRQELAWMLEDLFSAIKKVNARAASEAGGGGVPASVVKRIRGIVAAPHPYFVTANAAGASGEDPLAAPAESGSATPTVVQIDPKRVSGRYSGPSAKNGAFDVRRLQITAVVSTTRLPQFLDALTETNFITVTMANMTQVAAREELEQGFYYGDEHVVRVDLMLEWCWLREWTGPLMPAEVKKIVGYRDPAAPASEDAPKKKGGGG